MKKSIILIYIILTSFSLYSEELTNSDENYILGNKDTIQYNIEVNGIDIVSLRNQYKSTDKLITTINSDGTANFYMLGAIKCSNISIKELKDKLERKYSEFYTEPKIKLYIDEKTNFYIYILGEVSQKGIYYVKTKNDILSVLTEEGGGSSMLLPSSRIDKVELRRNKKTIIIDFDKLLNYGKMEQNIKLKAQDVIFVPKAENIYVYGEVETPGQYYKQTSEYSIMKLLESAGRWTNDALIRKIVVYRKDKKTKKTKKYFVNLEKLTKFGDARYDVELKDGDIVYVPRNDRPDWGAFSEVVSGITTTFTSFKGWK